jgi:alanyl-tRNA synthetase
VERESLISSLSRPNLTDQARHVNKTGDIKSIVITEESGIAKGIRRITAVTGHEAAEVTRIADELSSRLDALEKAPQDAGLKAFTVELDKADISVLRKAELKERFAKARKSFDEKGKAKAAAASKAVSISTWIACAGGLVNWGTRLSRD